MYGEQYSTGRILNSLSQISILVLACLVVGCESSPYSLPKFSKSTTAGAGSSQSAVRSKGVDSRLTQSSEAKFFSKSGWKACSGGALMGAVGCQFSNTSDKELCMLKAAVVGCGVAMGANYYLDLRRSEYANVEQRLDTVIADVRQDNEKLKNLSYTAKTVLAEDKQKLKQISQDIAAKNARSAQAATHLAEIDANTRYLRNTLFGLKKRQKQWQTVVASERSSGARLDQLNAEIAKMETQIGSLEADINELYSQRSAIKIG